MSDAPDHIHSEAIGWHLRLRDGDAAAWEAFAAWLEGDPARSAAYDAVALADQVLTAEAFPVPPAIAANDDFVTSSGRRHRRWAGALAAVAAALLAAWLAIPRLMPGPDRYEVATAAGEHRMVTIAPGSTVELNGGTRLILDHNDPRTAELAAGEAAFTIVHDPAHPFTVVAGAHRVQDAGTSFDLVRDGDDFTVSVIEGALVYDPGGVAVRLAAGRTLHAGGDGHAIVGNADPAAMAGWRRGRLSYTATPLTDVARDLSRNLGVRIMVDPAVATLPFTGSIRVDRDAAATVAGFASTLGLAARREGAAWRIEPHAHARR
jgi:transmembrane sensor